MKRANRRTVLGLLLLLASSACSAGVDGGLEPPGASGGDAIATRSSPTAGARDAAVDRSTPRSDGPGGHAPAGAASAGGELEPTDRTVEDRSPDRPPREPAETSRSRRLLYRRLP